jgi:peroxiredoxin Q/BCP
MAAKKQTAPKQTKPEPKAKAPSKPVKAAKPVTAVKAPSKPVKAAKAPSKPVKAAATKLPKAKPEKASKRSELIDVGSEAPSFELSDASGSRVSSSSLGGKPYLLYFYPKDDTPGCTKEACDIRDSFARFGKLGLRVLGVSPDSPQSHAKFVTKYGLPFTLLSDPDKTLANAYGVWGEKNNYGKTYFGIIRSSFLVGADGVVKQAYRAVKVNGHVDAVLEDARALV